MCGTWGLCTVPQKKKKLRNQESTKKKEKGMRERGSLRGKERDRDFLSMVVHTYNSGILEAEGGGL